MFLKIMNIKLIITLLNKKMKSLKNLLIMLIILLIVNGKIILLMILHIFKVNKIIILFQPLISFKKVLKRVKLIKQIIVLKSNKVKIVNNLNNKKIQLKIKIILKNIKKILNFNF